MSARLLATWLALALGAGAASAADLVPAPVAQALAAAPPGTRVGLLVVDEAGRPLVSLRADERFVPASNTKLFTSAAAFATLDVDRPDAPGGAAVRLEGAGPAPDVVLVGGGDARLSSGPDCRDDCLATLAAAVAARTRRVRDVIGDDSAFPDQRWPLGMAWNNMAGRYGTAVSALTVDDNEVAVTARPTRPGAPPAIDADGYFVIDDRATTGAAGTATTLRLERAPGTRTLHVAGSLAAGHAPVTLAAGIDDPADRAAWRLRALLRAAGVRVAGTIRVRHRPAAAWDDPAVRGAAPPPALPHAPVLVRLVPPPLAEDLRHTMKVSQNLHAELLLRRVGAAAGTGSVEDGHAVVARLLGSAGARADAAYFADGSGMSTYNRVTPAAVVALLRWGGAQPWGAAWRATFPVGGVDGTLRRRFAGTPLAGKLFAKTGSLNAASGLAGYLVAASGRTLTFAAYANDMPADAPAIRAVDAALLAVAAAN